VNASAGGVPPSVHGTALWWCRSLTRSNDDEQQQDGHDSAHLPEGFADHLGQGQAVMSPMAWSRGRPANYQGELLLQLRQQGDVTHGPLADVGQSVGPDGWTSAAALDAGDVQAGAGFEVVKGTSRPAGVASAQAA